MPTALLSGMTRDTDVRISLRHDRFAPIIGHSCSFGSPLKADAVSSRHLQVEAVARIPIGPPKRHTPPFTAPNAVLPKSLRRYSSRFIQNKLQTAAETGDALAGERLAFATGYLVHAGSDTFAHSYVNSYAGDIFVLTDERAAKLRRNLLEKYIDARLPAGTLIRRRYRCRPSSRATSGRLALIGPAID